VSGGSEEQASRSAVGRARRRGRRAVGRGIGA
jgi:hypothetical protein